MDPPARYPEHREDRLEQVTGTPRLAQAWSGTDGLFHRHADPDNLTGPIR
jgi:hypothetical protein